MTYRCNLLSIESRSQLAFSHPTPRDIVLLAWDSVTHCTKSLGVDALLSLPAL